MSNELSNVERETHLNMVADDRSVWIVFTDDPVMMRKFDKIAELKRVVGAGKEYRLRAEQVSFRSGKRQLSDEQKAKLSARMQAMHRNKATA